MKPANTNRLSALTLALLPVFYPVAQADVVVPGDSFVNLEAMNGDGSIFGGSVNVTGQGSSGFIWDAGGATSVGKLSGFDDSYVEGVSDDGGVAAVLNTRFDASFNYYSTAAVWTPTGGLVALSGLATGANTNVDDVSADGNVLVGKANLSADPAVATAHAVRWVGSNHTLENLTTGSSGWTTGSDAFSSAGAASDDGAVVVGYGKNASSQFHAFRWTSGSGMVDLGVLNGKNASDATNVSGDGQVVIGGSYTFAAPTPDIRAYRWSQSGGMVDLGDLSGFVTTRAYGVNQDGSVIVGFADNNSGDTEAFRWNSTGGMQSVADWLTGNGVNLANGTELNGANDVSDDGNTVLGWGVINGINQSYIARVGGSVAVTSFPTTGGSGGGDTGGGGGTGGGGTGGGGTGGGGTGGGGTGGGVIGLTDFNNSLATWQQSLNSIAQRYGLSLWGSHHRTLMDTGLTNDNGTGVWVTGDYAHHHDSDSKQGLGEVGVFHDFAPSLRMGLGLGANGVRQDLSFNGETKANGGYAVLEADYAPTGKRDLIISATGLYGNMDAKIRRGYLNGAALDSSTGDTDADTFALRFRLDKQGAAQLGSFSLNPYAAYSYSRTELDAYTETGGGFPVAYNDQTIKTHELRLGATAKTALSHHTDLRINAELVSAKTDTNAVGGTLLGAGGFAFNFAATDDTQTWGRLGVEVDHRFNKHSVLSGSLYGASEGNDASVSGSVSWKTVF